MKHFKISLGIVAAVVMLVALATPALAAEAKGKIKSVDTDKSKLVLTVDGKDMTFMLKDNAKIRVNDKNGQLRDLKTGDEITVTYQTQGERHIITEIRCTRKE